MTTKENTMTATTLTDESYPLGETEARARDAAELVRLRAVAESYPLLQAAIERRRVAMAQDRAAIAPQDRFSAQKEEQAAWEQANAEYADELLPRLLGGEWAMSGRDGFNLVSPVRPLFDHWRCFRRKGTKGPNRWDICAMIAHPYGLGEAEKQVADLLRHRVGVWVRDDLSAWYPGSTTMTLAAKDLHLMPTRAAFFGFRLLEARVDAAPPEVS